MRTVFDKIHASRLTRLADALEHMEPKQYGLARWDYEQFLLAPDSTPGGLCGTAGCALGACITLFPEAWTSDPLPHTDDCRLPHLKGDASLHKGSLTSMPYKAAQKFFGLTHAQALHLFCPKDQQPNRYGGDVLYDNATPQQVAGNIRAFLEYKRRQEHDSAGKKEG